MKYVWPALIFFGAATVTVLLFVLRPTPEVAAPQPYIPTVQVFSADSEKIQLLIRTQGIAQPRSEVTLTAEVGGRIQWISPAFETGGFFLEDEVLLEIEALQFESALAEAHARLAAAELALAQERAQGEQARREWQEHGSQDPTPLLRREPQERMALAEKAAAEAAVRIATRNLEQTRVRAPYDGRIREKLADLGQVLSPHATPIARIYAIDYAEVRLPLAQHDAAKLPLIERFDQAADFAPVRARFYENAASASSGWEGEVVRTEGVIDPRTRMLTVVGRIADPYQRDQNKDRTRRPLHVGQFVRAELEGIVIENAFRVPRAALVDESTIRVVESGDRLHARHVRIAHTTPDHVVVTEGLSSGDRISLTPVDFFIEGMRVAPVAERTAAEETP